MLLILSNIIKTFLHKLNKYIYQPTKFKQNVTFTFCAYFVNLNCNYLKYSKLNGLLRDLVKSANLGPFDFNLCKRSSDVSF